jgi:hypothetical protein
MTSSLGRRKDCSSTSKRSHPLKSNQASAGIFRGSRDQYYAVGRPCACPDDRMRNGRARGGRGAYSRPGGAAPLCYPSDVTAAMIDSHRQRHASR